MAVALIQYEPTDAAIAEMKQRLKAELFDCSTPSGYEGCRKAIAEVRSIRVNIEKHRVALKAEALEYGRKVDSEAKRITAELESIEDPLKAKKQAIDDEKERIKREAEEKRLAAIKAEQDRIAAEAEAKRQAEIAAENARMAAEREALRVEQEKLAAERDELDRQKLAKETAERVERETRERIERERIEAERTAKVEAERLAAEAARIEALKPDVQRLGDWMDRIESANLSKPTLTNDQSSAAASACEKAVFIAMSHLQKWIDEEAR
jgi:hypothetical protein